MSSSNIISGKYGLFKSIASFFGIFAISEVVSRLINFDGVSQMTSIIITSSICVLGLGLFLFIRHSLTTKSTWGAFVILSAFVSTIGYWMMRAMWNPSFKEYITDLLPIDDSYILFISFFSYGYSTFQFVIGYFVSKFGTRFIGFFGIFNAVLLFIFKGFAEETSIGLILFVRFLSGVFCSSAMISIGYHINKFKCIPEKFGVISNVAIVFAAVSSGIIINHFGQVDDVAFEFLHNILIGLFAIPGCIFVVDSFVTKDGSDHFNMSDYYQYFSSLISNRKYFIMFIQSIFVLVAFCVFRDKFLEEIAQDSVGNEELLLESANSLKFILEKGVIAGLALMISFLNFLGYFRTIFFTSFLNFIGSSIILVNAFLFDVPFFIVQCALFVISAGQIGHTVVQSFVGEMEGKNPSKAAGMIAILNTATMLVGGAVIAQTLIPKLSYEYAVFAVFALSCISFFLGFYCLMSFNNNKYK